MSLRRRRTIGPSFPYLSTPYSGVGGGGGDVYDADTTAWVSAVTGAGGTVSDAQKDRVDDLVVGLKAASLWTKCDALWLWAGEAVSAQALRDIRGLRVLTIPVGTETLTWRGYISPGGDAVLNTGIALTTGGLQYSLNSASVGAYVAMQAAGVGIDGAYIFGTNDGTSSVNLRIYFSAFQALRSMVNDFTTHDVTTTADFKDGFFLATRTSSSTRAVYHDGALAGSAITETSISVPVNPLVFSGQNEGGSSYTTGDQDYYCLGWVGAGLNSTEAANLSSLILAYLANYNIAPTYNLLVATQDFTNGSWWSIGGNLNRSADVTAAPDGTTTADKVWVVTSTSDERVGQTPSFGVSGTNTLSCYVKTAGMAWVYIRALGADDITGWFNVATGATGSVTGAGGSLAISADLGGGWYRCSVTSPGSPVNCRIGPADSDGTTNQTASGTNGLYLWGAQLVGGSSPLAYNRIP